MKRLLWCDPPPGAGGRGKAERWESKSPANPSDPQCAKAIVRRRKNLAWPVKGATIQLGRTSRHTVTTFAMRSFSLPPKLEEHWKGVLTPGIAALGPAAVERIVKTIAVFDDFCHANDPYEEHDFGSFETDGTMIYSK